MKKSNQAYLLITLALLGYDVKDAIEIIKLYCGLDKPNSYRMIEIAKMLDMFRQRADQHRADAIESLSNSARLKYIKELYEAYSKIDLPETEEYTINEKSLVYEKDSYLKHYILKKNL